MGHSFYCRSFKGLGSNRNRSQTWPCYSQVVPEQHGEITPRQSSRVRLPGTPRGQGAQWQTRSLDTYSAGTDGKPALWQEQERRKPSLAPRRHVALHCPGREPVQPAVRKQGPCSFLSTFEKARNPSQATQLVNPMSLEPFLNDIPPITT